MKYCIAIGSLQYGGAERTVATFANYLVKSGNSVSIVVLHNLPLFFSIDPAVKIYKPKSNWKGKNKLKTLIFLIKHIRKSLRKEKPEVVLSFMFPSFFLLSTFGIRVKKIISIRNNPIKFEKFDSLLTRRILFRLAHGIIAQTKYAKSVLYKQTKHKNITVIPNFVRKIEALNVPKEKIIITVGRLINGKGHDQLIEIFSKTKKKDWRLLFVGNGPEKSNLEKMAKAFGVFDKIDFVGFQENVDFFLQKSEIFAFCSQSEGFPNALLEAMATPLTCIAYDCNAGPSEIIDNNNNGFLIPLNNKKEFGEKLLELMENSEKRNLFKINAIEIREKFSVNKVAAEYVKFLNS